MTNYNQWEKREASKDGASLVKNSGRGREKGDAKLGNFLIDYKNYAKCISITEENWNKLAQDAWNNGQRDPLLVLKFKGGKTNLAVVDWALFKDLYELAEIYKDLRDS